MSLATSKSGAVRPRLILLAQFFSPEPTMKGLAFARRLDELGFDVEVVTGFPNYPGGKLYPGYRIRAIQREEMDGIPVTRLALYPSHDRSRIGRVLNYVSFFLSATFYLLFRAPRADVLYVYHPPLTVALAGALTRLLRRTPIVLDVQDMWPDTLRATGMLNNERALRLIGAVCRWTWRRADRIAVLSEGFRRLLIERGVAEDRINVIHNWADRDVGAGVDTPSEPDGPRAPSAAIPAPGKFRVLFAGNMGPAQALDAVLDAAAIVARTHQDSEFCFLGSGLDKERLAARAARDGIGNTRFLPQVPMAEVGAWLAGADCLLVHLKADPLFAVTIPSKTQAYLAAGRPIIMAVEGDAAALVQRAGAGLVTPPENPQALADAVLRLAALTPAERAQIGASARAYYEQELSFERGVRAFAALFSDVARGA